MQLFLLLITCKNRCLWISEKNIFLSGVSFHRRQEFITYENKIHDFYWCMRSRELFFVGLLGLFLCGGGDCFGLAGGLATRTTGPITCCCCGASVALFLALPSHRCALVIALSRSGFNCGNSLTTEASRGFTIKFTKFSASLAWSVLSLSQKGEVCKSCFFSLSPCCC